MTSEVLKLFFNIKNTLHVNSKDKAKLSSVRQNYSSLEKLQAN